MEVHLQHLKKLTKNKSIKTMKTKLHIVIFAIMTIVITETYGQNGVGVNNPAPSDTLDVLGTAKISRYLKVGNPSAPPTQTFDLYKLYDLLPNGGFGGVDVLNSTCSGSTTSWGLVQNGASKSYFSFSGTTRSFSRLLTSWIWIPSGSTSPYVDLEWGIPTSDATYDGMFFEYTLDGTTFTKITPAGGTAYSTTAFALTGGFNDQKTRDAFRENEVKYVQAIIHDLISEKMVDINGNRMELAQKQLDDLKAVTWAQAHNLDSLDDSNNTETAQK